MTYFDLIRDADRKLDKGDITLGEYEKMIEPLKREIDHTADIGKKAEGDCISRQAAIDVLARMMPRSYTSDGSHPADEEIFRAQEVFADCIEALEILPSAQPEIIRCKDCKYRYLDGMIWNCPFGLSGGEDFFCAYGAIGGGSGT